MNDVKATRLMKCNVRLQMMIVMVLCCVLNQSINPSIHIELKLNEWVRFIIEKK